jgi:hypothetical protein
MADFPFPTNKEDVKNGRLNGEYDHWAFASTNVVIWQSILTLNSAIPVIAFHESFNHEAEYLPNEKKWRWTYSFDEGQHTYQANLYAKLDGNQVLWEMYVSKSGVFEDFLWYSGISAVDESLGSWKIYGYPQGDSKA